jgi:quercetin dioxygenase-like cupin family protein
VDKTAFEAELRRDGYGEISVVRFEIGHDLPVHAHAYDVRALVIEGELTIVVGGKPRRYRPGEVFSLAAGCPHAEQAGPEGVRFLSGRRRAPRPVAEHAGEGAR